MVQVLVRLPHVASVIMLLGIVAWTFKLKADSPQKASLGTLGVAV